MPLDCHLHFHFSQDSNLKVRTWKQLLSGSGSGEWAGRRHMCGRIARIFSNFSSFSDASGMLARAIDTTQNDLTMSPAHLLLHPFGLWIADAFVA